MPKPNEVEENPINYKKMQWKRLRMWPPWPPLKSDDCSVNINEYIKQPHIWDNVLLFLGKNCGAFSGVCKDFRAHALRVLGSPICPDQPHMMFLQHALLQKGILCMCCGLRPGIFQRPITICEDCTGHLCDFRQFTPKQAFYVIKKMTGNYPEPYNDLKVDGNEVVDWILDATGHSREFIKWKLTLLLGSTFVVVPQEGFLASRAWLAGIIERFTVQVAMCVYVRNPLLFREVWGYKGVQEYSEDFKRDVLVFSSRTHRTCYKSVHVTGWAEPVLDSLFCWSEILHTYTGDVYAIRDRPHARGKIGTIAVQMYVYQKMIYKYKHGIIL